MLEKYFVSTMQSAYRRHHSNLTAVHIVYIDAVEAVNKGQQLTTLVCLDFSSAFYTTVFYQVMGSVPRCPVLRHLYEILENPVSFIGD